MQLTSSFAAELNLETVCNGKTDLMGWVEKIHCCCCPTALLPHCVVSTARQQQSATKMPHHLSAFLVCSIHSEISVKFDMQHPTRLIWFGVKRGTTIILHPSFQAMYHGTVSRTWRTRKRTRRTKHQPVSTSNQSPESHSSSLVPLWDAFWPFSYECQKLKFIRSSYSYVRSYYSYQLSLLNPSNTYMVQSRNTELWSFVSESSCNS